MNFTCSLQVIKRWLCNLIATLLRRYYWPFALAGFSALAMAILCWTLETSETYWFWHRYFNIAIIIFLNLFTFSISYVCFLLKCFFTAFGTLQYTHLLFSSFVQKQIIFWIVRISYLQMETMNWPIKIHFQEVVRKWNNLYRIGWCKKGEGSFFKLWLRRVRVKVVQKCATAGIISLNGTYSFKISMEYLWDKRTFGPETNIHNGNSNILATWIRSHPRSQFWDQ